MIPINLTISGFLSYRNPVSIDFTAFDLACIAGNNGAGKSSILDAITWALFGQARKRDDAIINLQSETAEVSFTFLYEKNRYRVIRTNPRGKTTRLEFQIATASDLSTETTDGWKTLSERTLRATQARVEETLRLDYDTFINAAFFLQGKADQFTQQRPGDRKRILTSILGLEVWETYRLGAVERRKSIEGEINSLDGRLAEINAELTEEDSRIKHLAELEDELKRLAKVRSTQEAVLEDIKKITATLAEQGKLVEALSQQLDSNKKRMVDLEGRMEARQRDADHHKEILSKKSEIEASYQSWLESREALSQWDETADQFREQEKLRLPHVTEIKTEEARLEKEIETLEIQAVKIKGQVSEIPGLQASIADLQRSADTLQAGIEERKSIETELTAAQEIFANAKAENPRLKAEMDELKDRIDQLTETDGAACPLCGQPLTSEERSNLVEELTIVGKTMGDKYRANRVLLAEADDNVNKLKSQVQSMVGLDDQLLGVKNHLNKVSTQISQIEEQKESWENEGHPRLEEIHMCLKEEAYALEARKNLHKIDAELKEIGYDAAQHDAIRRLEKEGRRAGDEYRALERAEAALEPLGNEITNLNTQINDLQEEISDQQNRFDQAAANLAAAQAQAPDIQQAQRDLLDIQENENKLRLEVGAARQKVFVLDDLKTRQKTLEVERETFARKVGQYKQLERAFSKDGVPALLIEQALPQIELKANDILERLTGGNMSVRFITQREYKDKHREDMRETLDIQISDSAGIRDYEMYSGGEAFRVNFAIRLALSEVLAQRAGARLQTLVIDEGFGSQDELGRQRLIEAINTVKPDFEKILVITHIESMKDAFPARIEVEKTTQGSIVNIV
jgi:exonuclease SbcC